ncbi:MAG: helix-turn-helix transcriptional regulator [Saprospiraceae bacterium]|jgi:DNA-binding transcriptional ArsR family regulator|nr:helix-turn-helix transcriptional regulator [Saprospiraceae bacterium]
MRKIKVSINHEKLQTSSEILRALAHPLRMMILEFIDTNKSVHVNEIYNTLKLEQSITSQHLRVLRAAGVVVTKREGKYIHYAIDYSKVSNATSAVGQFLERNEVILEDEDY